MLTAALLLGFSPARQAHRTPPNIVVFIADDQGGRDSSVYGAKDIRTPNMARLARAGLTFDNAFVASPSCAPSRAAMLTGLMPVRNGAMENHAAPRADLKKLPAYLKELGYEVVAIGKVAHYEQAKDYGFDYFAHDTFHDDAAVPAALAWLRERRSTKPLAFFVGTNWPHVPWPTAKNAGGYDPARVKLPPTFVDTPDTRLARARYYAAVSIMDTELGQVYDLARETLGPNTLFIASSDNGAQFPFGKWNLYDAGIRCTMVAAWPGVIKAHSRTKAMVSWVDLLPTLEELAGGKPDPSWDGRSFAAVLKGKASTHRDRVFATHSRDGDWNVYPGRSVETDRWKYIRNLDPAARYTTHIDKADPFPGEVMYWKSWERATDPASTQKVSRYRARPAEELYDLKADPFETHNLAGDPRHASTLARLRAELDDWMREQGDKGLGSENRAGVVGRK